MDSGFRRNDDCKEASSIVHDPARAGGYAEKGSSTLPICEAGTAVFGTSRE